MHTESHKFISNSSSQPVMCYPHKITLGVQGWRSGESTRLPPMWPGFDSQIRCPMWVEFVGSLLRTKRFSPGTPVFPSPQKPKLDLICVNLLISIYSVPD